MKIAIVFDLSEEGGVQTCVFSLIKGLNEKNIVPTILWDIAPNQKLIAEQGLKINYKKINFILSSKLKKKLPNIVRYLLLPFNFKSIKKIDNGYDFFYIFAPLVKIDKKINHLFYLSGPPLLPQLESREFKFKVAKFIYTYFIKTFYPVYEPQKEANYVINSQYTSDMFYEAHGRRLEVVYPSNKIKNFKLNIDNIGSKKYVTFFSRIVDYKRPEFIIQLAEIYTNTNFVIMGGLSLNRVKYYEQLQDTVKDKNLKNVNFIINPENNKVIEILNQTNIYIFPAINEHFGITTVEAILKGCIPFVHNSGGQKEIVKNENLRFNDYEFFTKFESIINIDKKLKLKLLLELNEYCGKFSEKEFICKMLSYL